MADERVEKAHLPLLPLKPEKGLQFTEGAERAERKVTLGKDERFEGKSDGEKGKKFIVREAKRLHDGAA
jgi:hypothetical protein